MLVVKSAIDGSALTDGIAFYGETNRDEQSLARLKELSQLLEDVMWHLTKLEDTVSSRGEYSAIKLKGQLTLMRSDLLYVAFGEEVAEKIIKLVKEVAE